MKELYPERKFRASTHNYLKDNKKSLHKQSKLIPAPSGEKTELQKEIEAAELKYKKPEKKTEKAKKEPINLDDAQKMILEMMGVKQSSNFHRPIAEAIE